MESHKFKFKLKLAWMDAVSRSKVIRHYQHIMACLEATTVQFLHSLIPRYTQREAGNVTRLPFAAPRLPR